MDDSIAVVIPVYKGAAYLAEAIRSVLAQTLPASEIFVIDDGSPDNSAEIARGFPGVTVITQANAGVSAARNNGIRLAQSTWIALLDQDDLWEPRKLERQLAALHAHPGADVCFAGLRNLRQVGTTSEFRIENYRAVPPDQRIVRELYGKYRIVPSAVLARRSSLLQVDGFDPASSPCEDWDLWLRMEQAGATFTGCDEPLTQYRHHTSMGSGNGHKMYLAEMRVFDLRIAPRVAPWLRPFLRLRAQSAFLAGEAIIEREFRRPHLRIMLRSLVTWPFGNWRRYVIAASMLLKGGAR
jgi:glycosyltransferase involved in cell wall biosynthesis